MSKDFFFNFWVKIMSVCFRPLPEDDNSIEADVLAVTGPESQPGKNLT